MKRSASCAVHAIGCYGLQRAECDGVMDLFIIGWSSLRNVLGNYPGHAQKC